jgi:hypothetical protein
MKSKVIIAVVLLLALLNASAGCAWFRGSKPLVDIMKKVPLDSTSFNYWAIEKLAEDEDLWDIYVKFRDESLEADQLKDIMEVRLSSVKHGAKVSGFDGSVGVFVGDFAIKIIAQRLEDKGYQKTTYQETEIWTPQDDPGYESVALREGTILIGDVEDLKACIDTIVKEEYSLYDDPDIRLVADKLPEGVIINISRADSEEDYADLLTYGKSYGKKDEGRLKLTAIYMFLDSYAAGEARDEIEGYLETKNFTDIKVEREGSFIRATALIDITYFGQTLAF